MQLTLVVPGLLDLAETAPAEADAAGAALARLLASERAPAAGAGAIGTLCTALGIARQRDWPVAPLLAAAANLDPGNAYWLRAEPVMLVAGLHDVRLAAIVEDLSADEAAALQATLNSHFFGDDLRFYAMHPARWLIAAAGVQDLDTNPADEALGAPIGPFLPTGPDAPRWRRWQSEMQMLLFEHPVNAARERAGRLQANGVWVSGGGRGVGAPVRPRIASLYTDDAVQTDLARACGVAPAPLPPSLAAWQDSRPDLPSMVWLPDMRVNDGRAALAALDDRWAAPLATALATRAITQVAVVVTGRGRDLSFTPHRPSLVSRLRGRLASPRLSTLLAAGPG
ncbi:MAG: hypothetical protein ACREYB_01595 [Casimicrobiaceae bacterium]